MAPLRQRSSSSSEGETAMDTDYDVVVHGRIAGRNAAGARATNVR